MAGKGQNPLLWAAGGGFIAWLLFHCKATPTTPAPTTQAFRNPIPPAGGGGFPPAAAGPFGGPGSPAMGFPPNGPPATGFPPVAAFPAPPFPAPVQRFGIAPNLGPQAFVALPIQPPGTSTK